MYPAGTNLVVVHVAIGEQEGTVSQPDDGCDLLKLPAAVGQQIGFLQGEV